MVRGTRTLTPYSEVPMPDRKTSTRAASASAKVLSNPKATSAAKSAAGSALSQTGRVANTGARAASLAGKALASEKTSPRGRKAAGSALSQAPRKSAKK